MQDDANIVGTKSDEQNIRDERQASTSARNDADEELAPLPDENAQIIAQSENNTQNDAQAEALSDNIAESDAQADDDKQTNSQADDDKQTESDTLSDDQSDGDANEENGEEAAADAIALSDAALATDAVADDHKTIAKERVLKEVKFFALLVFMSFLRATFNYMFILPNGFAPGGVGGISTILYNAILPSNPHLANTVFEPGLTTFIMNVPLLITAFFVLNKRFTLNTFCVIACYSGITSLYSHIHFPQYLANGDTGLQIIAALVGGSITGLCLGVMLRYNMSMGGTDIIGKIIHKHNPQAGANWWIMLCDCIIATSSCVLGVLKLKGTNIETTAALTAVLSPILFSFLSLAMCSIIADVVQSGFQSSLVFTIITDKPNEIGEQISNKLHRGVTISRAVGYYTGVEHEILTCVVSKKQINVVKKIVASIDPMAFTYITKAREVAGKGFRAGS